MILSRELVAAVASKTLQTDELALTTIQFCVPEIVGLPEDSFLTYGMLNEGALEEVLRFFVAMSRFLKGEFI